MRLLFTGILLIAFSFIQAQIVNIEEERLEEKEGLSGRVDLGLTFTRNTQDVLQFSNAVHVQYKRKSSTFLLLNDLAVVRTDNEDGVNRGFQHLRYNFHKKDRVIGYEAFAQHQFNKLQKINLRLLGGAGVRANFIKTDSLNLSFGLAAMYEHESPQEFPEENRVRASSYLAFGWEISKNVKFTTTSYYQPDVEDFNDFRISSQSSFQFKVNDHLRFRVTFDLVYDSDPIPGIPETNYTLQNGITYKF